VRFRLAHKVATYLLASTAVFTLGTAGVVSAVTLVLVVLLSAASWYADPETSLANGVARLGIVLNVLTLVFLAVAAFQVAHSFPDVDLLPFINFVLFLLALKLFQRRSNRDYLQIFILSFLILLAAAWLATSVVFIVGFGIYVVLATWTLVLFHLRREIEENYIVRHATESRTEQVTATRVLNSRRVVGAGFFASTGAVAVLVLLGSSLVFALVPRVGLGFILGGVRRPVGIAGFTDEVKLGMHGVISTDNQTVVLRAQIPSIEAIGSEQARDRAIASLYWRGTVYDTYEKGQWLRSRDEQTRTHLGSLQSPTLSREYWVSPPLEENPPRGRKAALGGAVEHTVEIVALSHPVAFALDRPVLFDMPAPAPGAFTAVDLEPRWSDEVSVRMFRINPVNPFDRRQAMTEFLGARYRAFSLLADRAHPDHRSLGIEQLPAGALDNYLRVPASLSTRLSALSKDITAGYAAPAAKVQAVVAWLRRTHSYTTNLKRNASIEDPLEDFLFSEKDGHCEYFASAAAILLRMGGVPTRYVNGFLGGEWNDLRQAVTVRENRAHSWVEAYLGQEGWVRVDATPALARASRMSAFRQVVDTAELLWGRWVVEYSASQQLLLAQKLGHRLGFSARGYDGGQRMSGLSRRQALIAAGFLVAVIVLISQGKRLGRWRRSSRGAEIGQRQQAPIERVYHATLKRLAAAGQPRLPTETPHEYLERLRTTKLEGAAVLAQLTELYTSSCYGDVDVPSEVVADLRRETHQIELGG
jgi:transglutaminase-like putative cysteine protease